MGCYWLGRGLKMRNLVFATLLLLSLQSYGANKKANEMLISDFYQPNSLPKFTLQLFPVSDNLSVSVNEPVTYLFPHKNARILYTLTVNSHGYAALQRFVIEDLTVINEDCLLDVAMGNDYVPVGPQSVLAVLAAQPITQLDHKLNKESQSAVSDKESEIQSYLASFQQNTASISGISFLHYNVEPAEGEFAFSTRGLTREYSALKPTNSPAAVAAEKMPAGDSISSHTAPIEFAFNSDQLTASGMRLVDVFGSSLREAASDAWISLRGHTDDVGDADYNLQLSKQRASRVKTYLIENFDLDSEKISVEAFGESAPLVPNTDSASRAKNRRVEIVVSK